jgi:hypothetical protein
VVVRPTLAPSLKKFRYFFRKNSDIVAVFLLIAGALWYYFGGFLFFDGDEPFYKIIGSILGVLGVLLIISGIITIFKK